MQGILNILLLNMSAYITKELGMAPGGEFRVAFNEVCYIFVLLKYDDLC